MNTQTRQSLNPTRTPEERAAFKAANKANGTIPGLHVITERTMSFTITWDTVEGRFGWATFHGCRDQEDAVQRFAAMRRGGNNGIPLTAEMSVVKKA